MALRMYPPHYLRAQEIRQRIRIPQRRLPRLFQQAGLLRLQLLRRRGRARRQQSNDREVFARGHVLQSIGRRLETDGSIRLKPAVAHSARLKERFPMCLAIPGKVLETADSGWNRVGKVQFGGVTREVFLDFVPEAGVGDYVLVHVGFAVSKVDEDEARRTCELLEQRGALEEGPPQPPGEPQL